MKKVIAWFVFLIVMLAGSITALNSTRDLKEKTWRDATLVQAYEYGDRCGYKGRETCSAWKGRFLVEPEHVYVDKEMDGFSYQTYVRDGRKDTPGYSIKINALDLGAKLPWYDIWAFIGVVVSGMLIFMSLIVAWFEGWFTEDWK